MDCELIARLIIRSQNLNSLNQGTMDPTYCDRKIFNLTKQGHDVVLMSDVRLNSNFHSVKTKFLYNSSQNSYDFIVNSTKTAGV